LQRLIWPAPAAADGG